MQHGAGAGIEWVVVIKCVGCGMQHPCTHAPPVVNLYPNSENLPKRVENPGPHSRPTPLYPNNSKSLKVSSLAVKSILLSDATVKYTSGSKAS